MNANNIIKALTNGAVNDFEFDVTTGEIDFDMIGSDGINYSKKAGLCVPYRFNDLVNYFFSPEVKSRILTGSHIQSISSEYLLECYLSGTIRCEINFYFPITNEYYRTLYFLYEDETSKHIMAYVVVRVITEVENEYFTVNGNKKNELHAEKEQFYKSMLNEQSCGVFAYTYPGYQIVTANSEALRMFGCKSIEQIQSKIVDTISLISYPSQDVLENLKRLRTEDTTVDYECIFNKGTENEVYVIAKTKVIYSQNGRRIIYSTYVDASEMHALQTAVDKAEEGAKAKSTFLFNMSHDLRTPMNAILGYAELIESHWDEREVAKDYLHKLMDSSKFLLFLLNNAIDLSSLENGIETIKESLWNVTRFNDTLVAIMENAIQEKNLRFSRTIDIEHENVMCDASKLHIIFLNLLSNAVKYTPTGGSVSMDLKELPSKKSGYALFQTVISDTGIGISPDFLPHIFENFSREKNTSLSGIRGAGLGMSVVKKMLDLMGGDIEIESSPGHGTRVIITLSHRIVSREEMMKYANTLHSLDMHRFNGKRILLAEDNELNAEIAVMILSDAGFICEHVINGEEAVNAVKEHPLNYYALILMDIQMPVMDGLKATHVIRLLPDERARIPIVAMTANVLEEDKRAALAAGMNGHLAKPINVEELLSTLADILE